MPQGVNRAEELHSRHRQLLLALQDLDFEQQTGKLSPEDHQAMRQRLQGEAVAVLQELERVSGQAPQDPEPPAGRDG
jgi:hypothetical protein